MRKLFFIWLTMAATIPSFAQMTKKEKKDERKQRINAMVKQEEEGVIAYKKQSAIGFKLTTDGYGGFYEIGRAQSIKKALLFQLDIAERKHPKEDKQTNYSAPSSPFIYGKINYFYPVKLGVQQQFVFGNKTNRNGVSVTGNFGGGLSLAFLRANNLYVNDLKNGNRKLIHYESNDSTMISNVGRPTFMADSVLFTDQTNLTNLMVSGSGFGKGWGPLKITPGLYAKAALRFDYGQYNEMVNALEVGMTGEFYAKKIPQLVYTEPKQYFLNLYVAIMFGKRK